MLAGETFLVREPGSGTRNLMERFFAESRVSLRIGMEMASNETIKQAVMAGLGIAFLSAHTVAAELADRRLALLDIAGLPVVRPVVHRPAGTPAAVAGRPGASAIPHRRRREVFASNAAECGRPDVKVGGMQIEVMDFVEGARKARGVAVVIDVFRAFSVACYAYARGAKRLIPMAEIDAPPCR